MISLNLCNVERTQYACWNRLVNGEELNYDAGQAISHSGLTTWSLACERAA